MPEEGGKPIAGVADLAPGRFPGGSARVGAAVPYVTGTFFRMPTSVPVTLR